MELAYFPVRFRLVAGSSGGVSLESGARELKRAVYRYVTQPLATLVAENLILPGSKVVVKRGANGENLDFDTQDGTAELTSNNRPSVLIVDDNDSLLKFMKSVLSHVGWDLTVAVSAKQALHFARSSKFDLALVDYMLPDADGASLSIKLKAKHPAIRIVMMTGGGPMAFSPPNVLADVPVVQKPFVVDDLLKVLRGRWSPEPKLESASARNT